jgi:hypothetical protein
LLSLEVLTPIFWNAVPQRGIQIGHLSVECRKVGVFTDKSLYRLSGFGAVEAWTGGMNLARDANK